MSGFAKFCHEQGGDTFRHGTRPRCLLVPRGVLLRQDEQVADSPTSRAARRPPFLLLLSRRPWVLHAIIRAMDIYGSAIRLTMLLRSLRWRTRLASTPSPRAVVTNYLLVRLGWLVSHLVANERMRARLGCTASVGPLRRPRAHARYTCGGRPSVIARTRRYAHLDE
ncbi:hypothetical protein EXIGLDRAFT_406877 [Exidia glandulosa HHB12029]|uniref:Uncharacterized protein n=1 Tax=Exidia glandulosa HHB12029 TaxID=1314781 RepID=A0A165BI98_EXIGL|nr:hypothetical protein EXIGLDRAFT_406877 [Exidia glandulosa HHB12029]